MRRGLTLVEVIAALALLATVISAVLAAQVRSMNQVHRADQQRHAAELAEALLTQWRLDGQRVDEPGQGTWAEPGWSWLREVRREHIAMARPAGATGPEMTAVRLAIRHERDTGTPAEVYSVSWLEPLPVKTP